MTATPHSLWSRYKSHLYSDAQTRFLLDVSRMNFSEGFFEEMSTPMRKALAAMSELESGAISNPDEKRMVGHYWLRNPALAPNSEIRSSIESTLATIKSFAAKVHRGDLKSERGTPFRSLLLIGIGGSALGPQFVSQALGLGRGNKLNFYSIDNTDPDGIAMTLEAIPALSETLTLVISKSGGTKETRNGMLEVARAYQAAGLSFSKHAVAVTGDGSELYKVATSDKWLATFPMWDWVGGRTSEMSAVGLLPAALQGINIDELLEGARHMDQLTRAQDVKGNPAALLALLWYQAGAGRGLKDMVILPYKDRLLLMSKYLQQLVMESLGKERDLNGKIVNQGIAVYGNKGSTDQHAYVQQLRDGINNFFVTFIEVLKDFNKGHSAEALAKGELFYVDPGATSGDYLAGFLLGTREALAQNGRESITITIEQVNPFNVGMLIALFERAVGYYASLTNINAYHQPGVEAGKKAATAVLELQISIVKCLESKKGMLSVSEIAQAIGQPDKQEEIFKILNRLAACRRISEERAMPLWESKYGANK